MAVVAILATWNIVLTIWEKKGFIGSAEWFLSVIRNRMGRSAKKPGKKWYMIDRLRLNDDRKDIEWMDLRPRKLVGPDRERDSRLALWIACLGLVIFPLTFLALQVARKAERDEGPNKFNRLSLKISRWGIGWGSVATFYLSTVKGMVIG
jgi:hypothetical protein